MTSPTWRRLDRTTLAATGAVVLLVLTALVIGLVLSRSDAAPVTQAAPQRQEAPAPAAGLPAMDLPRNLGMLHSAPLTVEIPAIGVRSDLVDLYLNDDGTLQVPTDFAKAGWFAGGPYPGDDAGPPALIAGHVDSRRGPAVFYDLKKLQAGDEIRVARANGSEAVFLVYETQQFSKSALPTDDVYAPREESELVLITCTGVVDPRSGHYVDNYVVTARLDLTRSIGA